MTASKIDTKPTWTDPDDAPELTDDWFEGATLHEGGVVKRLPGQRGPGKKRPKESVTLRLDPEILEHFRQTGEGWQTRINDTLKVTVLSKLRRRRRARVARPAHSYAKKRA
ncbi:MULTISPECIES: BrnA antitoxin family protein [unclassified Aurantimonas]|uniref:BrnA antitoxin family protein n=1 Tax=unclassified Aurantimonas TaxID=2638230 RepID=UPI002E17E628|nr:MULTISPECIES: BrnA antitoxin family protein [unclassified Aurantimonas]MEC5293805.1 BrnA antitoxin family protein [Aurantimonas sp. C2-3-R2]MEC5414868.1 BrnA antitoxin family protein [Aurantimonas sp. C2-4-R8]